VKVALITPWPPQRSGIADYAYQVAGGLAERGVEITRVPLLPHRVWAALREAAAR